MSDTPQQLPKAQPPEVSNLPPGYVSYTFFAFHPATGPEVSNLPPGYVSYTFFAFHPATGHRIYSNDNATWVDEAGNPVPATGKK